MLLQRSPSDAYLTLPGGRVEWGETAEGALAREMREEIGEEVDGGRMRLLVENFFELDARAFHEIDMVHDVALRPGSRLYGPARRHPASDDASVTFEWAPLDRIDALDLPLRPAFLPEALRRTPEALHHVRHHDPTWKGARA